MKKIKIILLAFIVIALAHVNAQPTHPLIGKWQTVYDLEGEKVYVNYQFKKINGKLFCTTLFLKDEKGNSEAYNTVAMSDIDFENKKGKAQYMLKYEGELYEVEASLYLTNANTLEVRYSYYGYTNAEIWKKVE